MFNLNLLAMRINTSSPMGLCFGIVVLVSGIYLTAKFFITKGKGQRINARVTGYKESTDTKGRVIYFPVFAVSSDNGESEISSSTGDYNQKYALDSEVPVYYIKGTKTITPVGDNKELTTGLLCVAVGLYFCIAYFMR